MSKLPYPHLSIGIVIMKFYKINGNTISAITWNIELNPAADVKA